MFKAIAAELSDKLVWSKLSPNLAIYLILNLWAR